MRNTLSSSSSSSSSFFPLLSLGTLISDCPWCEITGATQLGLVVLVAFGRRPLYF